jgi:hypothetical protein
LVSLEAPCRLPHNPTAAALPSCTSCIALSKPVVHCLYSSLQLGFFGRSLQASS